MGKVFAHSLTPLLLFSIALSALLTIQLAAGVAPSSSFEIAASFSWSVLLALWIVTDARRHKGIPCFDFGFFCYAFLPVAIPWYCFWSRGWRGMATLVAIMVLWLAPYIVANAVWLVLYG